MKTLSTSAHATALATRIPSWSTPPTHCGGTSVRATAVAVGRVLSEARRDVSTGRTHAMGGTRWGRWYRRGLLWRHRILLRVCRMLVHPCDRYALDVAQPTAMRPNGTQVRLREQYARHMSEATSKKYTLDLYFCVYDVHLLEITSPTSRTLREYFHSSRRMHITSTHLLHCISHCGDQMSRR